MIIIPAIDIKGGKCVRLYQGEMDKATIYNNNPVEVAVEWQKRGARLLHVVDLDGAVEGTPVNIGLIKKIISSVKIPVQVGGGIRSKEVAVAYLKAGAWRVVLGTRAVYDIGYVKELARTFPGRIVISLDARDGKVAVQGWKELTEIEVLELAKKFEKSKIGAIIYTNIRRDGTLEGPDIEGIERLVRALNIPVIASGGISSIEDIRNLKKIPAPGVVGVIIGRALYAGTIKIEEALALQ